ncbi:ABC transporter ATP-binding protein [Cytobacillus sp. FSL H8-0458]|uniref:ABC transporter ATP-binding protein n=1 Tax=Cytobacillus sp. FSL H8-0458 TaxID=2975346 RepID=UPI0030F96BC8
MSTVTDIPARTGDVKDIKSKKKAAPVLEVKKLSISLGSAFQQESKQLVKNVSFAIHQGEMLGLAGESGSGKSVTAAAILGLLPQSLNVSEGQILFQGKELINATKKEMRRLRGKEISFLFQNYQGSFTPFSRVGKQLIETLQSHQHFDKIQARQTALHWLERVELPSERVFESYPHQLSGGQLQRASLAAALMFKPSLIIADEPTTALDVLTGENILDLLAELQREVNCGVLLITHDIKHVIKRTNRMAVMFRGQLVEEGPTDFVREHPVHPYTKLLIWARPRLTKDAEDLEPRLTAQTGGDYYPFS